MTGQYNIAGLNLSVESPFLTGNFAPFAVEESGSADISLKAVPRREASFECLPAGDIVDKYCNDTGHVMLYSLEDAYLFSQCFVDGEHLQWMRCSRDFSEAEVALDLEDPFVDAALSSLVRIAFSQRIVLSGGVLAHASCIVKDDRAYLFLGRSGTGKSTHSSMWLAEYPDAELLNDDCPAVRVLPEGIFAFGTPWSGKTPCYKQKRSVLGGLVRLNQAPVNEWTDLAGVAAWGAFFPACSLIIKDELLYLQSVQTINFVVSSVPVGELNCLPDMGAARLCYEQLIK